MSQENGWKPLPLSLKVLFVLSVLWVLGSFMGISMRYQTGLPFMGVWVTGIVAAVVVLALDVVGPLAFLYGMWNRMLWAPKVALVYMGIFILNSVVALFTVRAQLGLMPILIPAVVTGILLAVVHKNREYFG